MLCYGVEMVSTVGRWLRIALLGVGAVYFVVIASPAFLSAPRRRDPRAYRAPRACNTFVIRDGKQVACPPRYSSEGVTRANRMTSVRLQRLAVFVIATLLASCGGAQARKAAYLAKGREYLAAHNFAKARLEFRNAVQLDPNDAEASFLAGRAMEALGNVREAVQMYQGAIQADPWHLRARAQLALIFAYRGAPAKAIDLAEAGLKFAPDDPDLLTARGAAHLRLGDAEGARAGKVRQPATGNSGHGGQVLGFGDFICTTPQGFKPLGLKTGQARVWAARVWGSK